MTEYEKLKALVYKACLEAALAMGDDLKKLSWFGRNKKGVVAALAENEKLAA